MTVKELLDTLVNNPDKNLTWTLPNNCNVEAHYHVTEVAKVTKHFVDCGGTEHKTETCVLQLWVAKDTHHRLETNKLAKIMQVASNIVNDDLLVEIEYETTSISQYLITGCENTPKGLLFYLGSKHTACLAPEKCNVTGCC
jgi:hypothetical protein